MIDLNKRIIDLSVADIIEILELFIGKDKQQDTASIDATKHNKHFVYGLSGIADLFGCSKTTANRIKQSGKIDEAIIQIGNLITIDADKALQLIKVNGKHSKNHDSD
jgi:hypothetical protein